MLPNWLTVEVLFLCLLVQVHDAEVVSRFRAEGLVPLDIEAMSLEQEAKMEDISLSQISGASYYEEDEMKEENTVIDVRDDGQKTFVHGMRVVGQGVDKVIVKGKPVDVTFLMDRIRSIKFMLDNPVRALYGKDAEVTAWVQSKGGLQAVQEVLAGNLPLGKGSWYQEAVRALRLDVGYDIPALGEPVNEVAADTATGYTSYAISVHRDLVTKKAFGEVEDDDETTPNWAASEFDVDLKKPWWWRFIAIGRRPIHTREGEVLENDGEDKFLKNLISEVAGRLVIRDGKAVRENPTRMSVPKWRPNICIGERFAEPPYRSLYSVYTEAQIDRNVKVNEFIHRFYNEPERLIWKEVKGRWMGAMRVAPGLVIWCPVTKKSSESINFFTCEGKRDPRTGWFDWSKTKEAGGVMAKRCLYLGQWVMPYQKIKDEPLVKVWKMKANNQTGLFEVWSVTTFGLPFEWAKAKKQVLRMGGVDAYFGHPEKLYKKEQE